MKRCLLGTILILSVFTLALGATSIFLKVERVSKPIHVADGSGPIQTCRPGTCGPDDQLRQMADGSGPIQTCRPGTCGPDDQLRQMADGSGPIQTCRPGTCGPDDQLRLTMVRVTTQFAEIYAG